MQRQLLNRILLLNIFTQAGIIFTGAVVRVSGSGLGCPTWPQCVPGSFVPVAHQAESWHKFVEYGNRTLTGVLIIVAALVLLGVYRSDADRQLRRLALVPLLGTVAQAILGGITVLTKLNSATVVAHFLLSVVLVAFSTLLWYRHRFGVAPLADQPKVQVANFTFGAAVLMLMLGSITSGSGPHSGDATVASALPLDPQLLSMLHSGSVWLFVAMLLVGWLRVDHSEFGRRMLHGATGLAGLNALVGYTQYALGLPVWLVGLHVLFAATLWVYTTLYVYALRRPVD